MATTPFTAAAAAYGHAASLITQGARPEAAAGAGQGGPDFAKLLSESISGVVEQGNHADRLALDMIDGKANVVDVVTAISETELAIETMVTVRDRVIAAYEEIMRMPI